MKKIYPTFLVILAVAFSFSCKKEISPDLEVTVVRNDNSPVRGAWVRTSAPDAVSGILRADVLDAAQTDGFGKAYFSYENTILIDIALLRQPNDTVLIDSATALLEVKRKAQRSDNITERKLVFR
ncbi:hypothetical protein N9515_05330 [Vicingaceae bacterium]|nr:hypothetical protein [Vicingaceae bacterium]MDB4061350.1 hypothetical protein [Vicingaceae bacterium]